MARGPSIPVIAISGSLGERYGEVHHHGIDAVAAITREPMTLDDAFAQSAELGLGHRGGVPLHEGGATGVSASMKSRFECMPPMPASVCLPAVDK